VKKTCAPRETLTIGGFAGRFICSGWKLAAFPNDAPLKSLGLTIPSSLFAVVDEVMNKAKAAMGQSRRSERPPATSGLPRLADILRGHRHVSNVPKNEPALRERAARGAGAADGVTR
jgi:hypothetical protein